MTPLRLVVLALAAIAVAGCARSAYTSLEKSWAEPGVSAPRYKRIVVLSVAADEFAQAAFQDTIAARLKERNVNAVASHRYFTHRSPSEEARFKRAIEAADADAVLLARVVGRDTATRSSPGYLITPSGVPYRESMGLDAAWNQAFNPTQYVPGRESERTDVIVETVLYDLKSRRAVWSARTLTTNAEQGDLKPAVSQFVDVLIGAMTRDGVI